MIAVCKELPDEKKLQDYDATWFVNYNTQKMPDAASFHPELSPRRELYHLYESDAISIQNLLQIYSNDLSKGNYSTEIDVLIAMSKHKKVLIMSPEVDYIKSVRRILYNHLKNICELDIVLS